MSDKRTHDSIEQVAIVGMSGRFAGARTLEEFWKNLKNGVESITFFSDEDLIASGAHPLIVKFPGFVKAGMVLDDIELFDASFFGYNPREAESLDPQQRIFLECAWAALEDAGYDSERFPGLIGVYAGCSISNYYMRNLMYNDEIIGAIGQFNTAIGNITDFLANRVSFKMNLRGPSMGIQSGCSTSLVAVQSAVNSLLSYQCDIALAGGVTVKPPQKSGYLYQEGMILSPDGHCRAFDVKAQGLTWGEGVGIVVLKRLSDAIADGDTIHAVILASATNNDGSAKVGFTAPSVEGQSTVIATAHALAGIDVETIGFVEAHGTGTAVGDPIEVTALTKAFRMGTDKKGFCALGSVKTNIGHTDAAAGVAGLIKAILVVKHGLIPPSLNFETPNPELKLDESPFYVNTSLVEWKRGETPRRAGVNSFGIGGTNAHVVLEEAPAHPSSDAARSWQVFPISAKSATALEKASENLVDHLKGKANTNAADAAYTLQVGRRYFGHRRIVVGRDAAEVVTALQARDPLKVFTSDGHGEEHHAAFMFTGQASQYVNMGKELYEKEPAFRDCVDTCASILKPVMDLDLREILYPAESGLGRANELLDQTFVTQPAVFVIEYALSQVLGEWGIRPKAMIGHSIGEYVAATLSGVFTLEEALRLVAVRGRLIQALPAGSMLTVFLAEDELRTLLGPALSIAVKNGPSLSVVSGPHEEVDALQERLEAKEISCRRLQTSHAFHSPMMEPALEPYLEQVRKVSLKSPQIPFVSNVSGTWIEEREAMDPGYWVRHLRSTVLFSEGLRNLFKMQDWVLLEVGAGRTLSSLASQHPERTRGQMVLSTMRHPQESLSDVQFLQTTLGRLWLAGVSIDWAGVHRRERRARIPLPTYPFERQRFWAEPPKDLFDNKKRKSILKKPKTADWLYAPSWKQAPLPGRISGRGEVREKQSWLLFLDEKGVGARIAEALREQGHTVTTVQSGRGFLKQGEAAYTINPRERAGYSALLKEIQATGKPPDRIVHLFSVTGATPQGQHAEAFEHLQYLGFYSLVFLSQALGEIRLLDPLRLDVISNGIFEVTEGESLDPNKATLLGPSRVIPQEQTQVSCRNIDICLPETGSRKEGILVEQLMNELESESPDPIISFRGKYRWVQTFEAIPSNGASPSAAVLRQEGVYLITGGLGGLGLTFAEYLGRKVKARLALVGRSVFPPREKWGEWLASHDDSDATSYKISRLKGLEESGAEVLIMSADVSDETQLRGVISAIDARFGRLDGVLHTAGILDQSAFRMIEEIKVEECNLRFRPKVQGLFALENVLRGRKLDFCLVTSSLASLLGGIGYCSYAAANAFMDTFVFSRRATDSLPWVSTNWDGWQGGKVEALRIKKESEKVEGLLALVRSQLALAPEEGADALNSILSLESFPQVVISLSDLDVRLKQWVRPKPVGKEDEQQEKTTSTSSHLRPSLSNAFEAPTTEVEIGLAKIWGNLLGIDGVGIHDNFFELGGHSLLATQLISRIRGKYRVDVSVRSMFETPTIAGLAGRIEKEILAQVEKMPEEEAERVAEAASAPAR